MRYMVAIAKNEEYGRYVSQPVSRSKARDKFLEQINSLIVQGWSVTHIQTDYAKMRAKDDLEEATITVDSLPD